MKAWKKTVSLTLSLVMLLSVALCVPASAEEPSPKIQVSVNVTDSDALLLEETEFKLRGWDFDWGSGVITKRAVEDYNVAPYGLPLGTAFTVHVAGNNNSSVQINAWSDPDHDGVYDSWLEHHFSSENGDYIVEPVLLTGNRYLQDADGHAYYGAGAPVATNELDGAQIGVFPVWDVSFSAAWLLQTYGPDTLIIVSVRNTWDEQTGWTYENYPFYLIDEPVDPAILNVESQIAVTDGGALTSVWASELVSRAEENTLVPQNLCGFDLTGGMTRADFAAVTVNLCQALSGKKLPGDLEVPFTDLQNADTYQYVDNYKAICQAYSMGFVSGTGAATFSPDVVLNREQAAVMLAKVYETLYGKIPAVSTTGYADDASISGWAKSAVAFMSEKGMISGVGENRFAPQKLLSGQEALIIAERMLENLK